MPLSSRRLLALIGIQNEITSANLDLPAVMKLVVRRAAEIGHATGSMIALPGGDELTCQAAAGTASQNVNAYLKLTRFLAGPCLRTGKVYISRDREKDRRADVAGGRRSAVRSVACAPLIFGNRPVGVLVVTSARPSAFRAHDAAFVTMLAGVVAAQMSQAAAFEARVREISAVDALTGLPDRRAFEERLATHVQRRRRYGRPFTLAIFAVDNFREINDRYGHLAEDDILRCVAAILNVQKRGTDECFRTGDYEFAVIMPETQLHSASHPVARIARAVAASEIEQVKISVSHGVAEADDLDPTALLERARRALDETKRARRNNPRARHRLGRSI